MLRYKVPEMSCGHCVATITGAIKSVDPSAEVKAELERHEVDVESALDGQVIATAIEEAGYENDRIGC